MEEGEEERAKLVPKSDGEEEEWGKWGRRRTKKELRSYYGLPYNVEKKIGEWRAAIKKGQENEK